MPTLTHEAALQLVEEGKYPSVEAAQNDSRTKSSSIWESVGNVLGIKSDEAKLIEAQQRLDAKLAKQREISQRGRVLLSDLDKARLSLRVGTEQAETLRAEVEGRREYLRDIIGKASGPYGSADFTIFQILEYGRNLSGAMIASALAEEALIGLKQHVTDLEAEVKRFEHSNRINLRQIAMVEAETAATAPAAA